MLRFRLLSLLRRPSSDDMPPWKLLFDSCSFARELRLPIQGDKEPVMPSDARSRAMTRRGGGCALHVTPCQLQSSIDSLLHEAKNPGGPES